LEKLVDEGDEKAPGLLACTLQFSFLVALVVITSVLLTTAVLSRKLQYESLDLNDAAEYCEATITNLKGWKTEPHNENQNERNEEKHEQPSETEFAKLYAEAYRSVGC